jgi:hypothetical protein
MLNTTVISMLPTPNKTADVAFPAAAMVLGDDDTCHMNNSTMPPPHYAAKK